MLDLTSILGIVSGIMLVLFAVISNAGVSGLSNLYDPASALVTFGGMFCATAISFPGSVLMRLPAVTKKLFIAEKQNPASLIKQLVKFAEIARRDGILALENNMADIEDPFMTKGIQLAVDGTDPELIRETMTTELDYMQDRHEDGKKIFDNFGKYAPAFGMVGTLIGLVMMLSNLDDAASIGPNMAVAIITSFYGALAANLVWLPFADKLEIRSKEESMVKEIVIRGVMSIQSGDNPRIVEQKLKIFLAPALREEEES